MLTRTLSSEIKWKRLTTTTIQYLPDCLLLRESRNMCFFAFFGETNILKAGFWLLCRWLLIAHNNDCEFSFHFVGFCWVGCFKVIIKGPDWVGDLTTARTQQTSPPLRDNVFLPLNIIYSWGWNLQSWSHSTKTKTETTNENCSSRNQIESTGGRIHPCTVDTGGMRWVTQWNSWVQVTRWMSSDGDWMSFTLSVTLHKQLCSYHIQREKILWH